MELFDTFVNSCEHVTTYNGVCTVCGINVIDMDFQSGNYENCNKKLENFSISALEKDLNGIHIDEEIRSWIETQLNLNEQPVFHSESRSIILFSYLYLAHLHLGKDFDILSWANKMRLNRSNIEKAMKFMAGVHFKTATNIDENLTVTTLITSPLSLINGYCEKLGLELYKENIRENMRIFIQKNPSVEDENPYYLAAGYFKYYCDKRGLKPNFNLLDVKLNVIKKFCKIVETLN